MINEVQQQLQKKTQDLRWRVLSSCYNGKPMALGDVLVLRICADTGFNVERQHVREALDYLEGKELVTLKRNAVEWLSRITDDGTDVVEGNAECPAGINRPEW
jgi:hypothetical protein